MTNCEMGVSRRELLQKAAGGFASIALAGILADQQAQDARARRRSRIHWLPSGRTFRRERNG